MRKLGIALLAMVILATIGGGVVWTVYDRARAGSGSGPEVGVVIPPGSTGSQIAGLLEDDRVVGSAFFFRLFLTLKGAGGGLKAGEYRLRQGMSFEQALAALQKGPPVEFVKLTVAEGVNVEQTAAEVGRQTHVAPEAFLEAATPATVRPQMLPPDAQSLEGFLYPTTYFVTRKEAAADLVRRMVAQFEKETGRLPWDRATALNLTPYQVLVVASMIEEEAKSPDDRPLISAVIHNRLKRGMKLEIDATVQYAVRKYQGQPLTQSDLEVNSPYNTRRFPGLPPTPIASPRAASVAAALQPAQSDALYFVLSPDCVRHVFTADYNQFQRAAAQQCRSG